ncbi:hypothetical protein CG017_05743 (plasmid) [Burkholderia glumae]|nr:hypothetical protein CG017_05743 [Burkholderia glumae]
MTVWLEAGLQWEPITIRRSVAGGGMVFRERSTERAFFGEN